ncbi:thiamine pyrophosphate-binding protein [Vibrio mediterranei]|uniref:thiamine pyrophosphate-binding protein n=1 Tax=Vibrio mediterranei TaxID=689 RepID=UPI004067D99E
MANLYTREKNTQIIIQLLKSHNIKRVITSPGTANMALIGSIQNDPFFECYSCVDERSAAYMACGLAEETMEPVVLSCTGATASRNYLPGLTEAYYRKLPLLAITSVSSLYTGNLIPQVIDRSTLPVDSVKSSYTLPIVKDNDDYWHCELSVNKAILDLKRNGGGPVHINLPTIYDKNFDVKELPACRVIRRYINTDKLPKINAKRVGIFIGAHRKFSNQEIEAIEKFCMSNNAAIFCDHTSNYTGKFRLQFALAGAQELFDKSHLQPDLLIHIGEVSGDYYTQSIVGKEVWRVSEDGEIRDRFRRLRNVFQMRELDFFVKNFSDEKVCSDYFDLCNRTLNNIKEEMPELPFSNIWMARQLAPKIPAQSHLHFAILNSLRAWNFFELKESIHTTSNVGGFGIDGMLSTLIGASLHDKNKLYFGVVGDLAFFYDMNSLGNREVSSNVRVLVVNNGKGVEFRNASHAAEAVFGENTNQHIAASGHFGNKNENLVKDYAENLGYRYLSATNKEEFIDHCSDFVSEHKGEQPIIFEVFTNDFEESAALEAILKIKKDNHVRLKNKAKKMLGNKGVSVIKRLLKT